MSEIEAVKPSNGSSTFYTSSDHNPENHTPGRALDFYAPVRDTPNSTQEVSVSFEDDRKEEPADERGVDVGALPAMEGSPANDVDSPQDWNPPESETFASYGDDNTTVAIGGDVHSTVNKAKPSDDDGILGQDHVTGPLGDTYAQVSRPDYDDSNANAATESISRTMNFEDGPESSEDLAASPGNLDNFAGHPTADSQPMEDKTGEQAASMTFGTEDDYR